MSIFRAIGFGIFIITLRLLVPNVLGEGEQTIISVFRAMQTTADTVSSISASVSTARPSITDEPHSPSPLALPRTPNIVIR